jgi:tetratricopeptide (TPR) repeat protein
MLTIGKTVPDAVKVIDDIMPIGNVAAEMESSARYFLVRNTTRVKGLELLDAAAKCFERVNPERAQQMLIEVMEESENEGLGQAWLAKKQEAVELFFKALQACVEARSIDLGTGGRNVELKKRLGEKALQIFRNMKNLDMQDESNSGDSYVMLSEAAELIGSKREALEFKECALESFIFYARTNTTNAKSAANSLRKASFVVEELVNAAKGSISDPKERAERIALLDSKSEKIEDIAHGLDFMKLREI